MFAEKGGNPELIRESQRRRYADVSLVDKVIELDNEWRNGKGHTPQYSGSAWHVALLTWAHMHAPAQHEVCYVHK